MSRMWTEAERRYLEANWGITDTTVIMARLGRSHMAIQHATKKLHLGRPERASDKISAKELMVAIRGQGGKNGHPERRFARMGLRSRCLRNMGQTHYMIAIDEFWEWARSHMDYIDLGAFTPGTLGKEPDWMQEVRKKREGMRAWRKIWSDDEVRRLLTYMSDGMTTRQISEALGRSEKSVRHKAAYIGKLRPAYERRRLWSEQEKQQAAEYVMAGYSVREIAKLLGRGYRSTESALHRIIGDPAYMERYFREAES